MKLFLGHLPLCCYAVNNAGGGHSADARALAEEIEKGFVSESAKITYLGKIAQFVHYLLDNKPEYLSDEHHEELQMCHETDKFNATISEVRGEGNRNQTILVHMLRQL